MKRNPFDHKERVLDGKGVWRILMLGVIMATGAVVAFILSMKRGGWDFGNKFDPTSVLYIKSTSVAYAVLSMTQMSNLLQSRNESLSVFTIGFFKNKYLIGAIFLSIGMLLAFMHVPFFQYYLHMSPIDWQDWIVVVIVCIIVFIYEEARKAEKRKRI
jgi:Ca2+-transporting ATPase